MVQAPREIVAAVRIDSLEETGRDPEVHGQDVEVLSYQAPDDGDDNGTSTKDHGLNWRGIFRSKTERSRVLMVNLVDILVEEPIVENSMHPVMPCILQDEENRNLNCHCLPRRKWDTGIHTA